MRWRCIPIPNSNRPMPTKISGMRIASTALAAESRFDGNIATRARPNAARITPKPALTSVEYRPTCWSRSSISIVLVDSSSGDICL